MDSITSKTASTSRTTRLRPPVVGNEAYELGRKPPQVVELEEAVLGALMLEKEPLAQVIDILVPEAFYREAHQEIYASIKDLFSRSEPVDILTVTQDLRKRGILDRIGGPQYIVSLTNRVGSAANVEFHSRIVVEKFIQRELIRVATEISREAYEETTDVFELLDRSESSLFEIAEKNIRRGHEDMGSILNKALKELEGMKDRKDGMTGVPSGLTALDQLTGGFQKSNLVIIAARPGMGKTALVLSIARNAAVDYQKPVAVFSLEMSSVELVNRLLSGEAEVEGSKLRKGNLEKHEWDRIQAKMSGLANAKVYIDDTPALSIFDLRAKCRRLKAQFGIEMIVIDYLQLMSGGEQNKNKNGNREQEIAAISRGLKSLAKELEVPVLALSQLSRAVESRAGASKRPQLSDLRESGSIEQDADMVMFIYRDAYYFKDGEEVMDESNKTEADLIIAKHRNGPLEDVRVKFIGQYAKFTNADINYGAFGGGYTPIAQVAGPSDMGGGGQLTRASRGNAPLDEQTRPSKIGQHRPEDDAPPF